MKLLRQIALCLLLVTMAMSSALAAEVPEDMVVENLNGQQRIVKTYTLSPEVDPDSLREDEFTYDGYLYTWAYTLKEEHPYQNTKDVTETITVETSSKDLSAILAELKPTLAYDDGEFSGDLALDHTSLVTEAAGYTTKYSTTTETKVIGNLDRNDMSYVPATTTKNGKTLSLVDVEWQVTGTDLVGEALVPSRYQAVATYSASSSYQAATGYVTTAEYRGEVAAAGISDITYTVVYVGTEDDSSAGAGGMVFSSGTGQTFFIILLVLFALLLAAVLAYLYLHRKNVYIYQPGDSDNDYELIGKLRITEKYSSIPITALDPAPTGIVAIELKRSIARKLVGKEIKVICADGIYTYKVLQDKPSDWHEFNVDTRQEVIK